MANKKNVINATRETLIELSKIFQDADLMLETIKNDPQRWDAMGISSLEIYKNVVDTYAENLEEKFDRYKTVPKNLTAQFEAAKKRKAVVKGQLTKQQNKIRRKLGK